MELPKHLRWERHNGVIYLYAEYRYLEPEQIQPLLSSTLHYIANTVSMRHPCLHMIDVEGTEVNAKSLLQFSAAAKKVKPFIQKAATIGLPENHYRIVATIRKLVNINIHVFEKKAEAVHWLVQK